MSNHVYIIVRKDISNSQRVVQSCHLAWEVAQREKLDVHPSMVVIGVKNLNELKKAQERLTSLGLTLSSFQEPLINNELTAIGTYVNTEDQRNMFKKYNLLSNESFLSKKDQDAIKLKNCTHAKTYLTHTETMQYEFTPSKFCKKCHKLVTMTLNDEEKETLTKKFYKQIFELEISDKELAKIKDGFNL